MHLVSCCLLVASLKSWCNVQVALGAGLVAVTAWGVKALVYPYAVQAYRSWTGKPDPAAEKQQREVEIGKVVRQERYPAL